MKLLVFGKTGQVARELARIVPEAVFLSREDADLADPGRCAQAIVRIAPDAVINAAAYTAVDRAEGEEALALTINGDAPGFMAESCAAQGIPFIHISTDYVFGGAGQKPFKPDDPTGPLGAYGRTKLAGEQNVQMAGGTFVILRTSWVFSAHGQNFVKTMLRLSQERESLRIVDDQIGGPTPAADIAMACCTMAKHLREDPSSRGIYHFAGAPDTSWKGFAEAIFNASGRAIGITGIPSADYPTPASRPLNSRLDCTKTEQVFGLRRPDWRKAVASIVKGQT